VVIKYILHCYFWLQAALLESKISIKRVMSMFGFKKTEGKKSLESAASKPSEDGADSQPPPEDGAVSLTDDTKATDQNTFEESDELKKKLKIKTILVA
jgi:hypothetical protein